MDKSLSGSTHSAVAERVGVGAGAGAAAFFAAAFWAATALAILSACFWRSAARRRSRVALRRAFAFEQAPQAMVQLAEVNLILEITQVVKFLHFCVIDLEAILVAVRVIASRAAVHKPQAEGFPLLGTHCST